MIAWLPGVDGDRPPTDFDLLRAIWERHRDEFEAGIETSPTGQFMTIDIPAIAADLGIHRANVWGRLYYHLDSVYGQEREPNGDLKPLFLPSLPPPSRAKDCVNFPLLEAILAGLWERRTRERLTLSIAVVSLVIAIGSFAFAIFG